MRGGEKKNDETLIFWKNFQTDNNLQKKLEWEKNSFWKIFRGFGRKKKMICHPKKKNYKNNSEDTPKK